MALFKINNSAVKKLVARDVDLERNLQKLFEANLEEILDITFLAHEYSTSFGGRIDTLGIDRNGSPCIIEYKKSQNDNVINQGLSYLLWLLDHKADFDNLLSAKKMKIGVEWDSPRVICVAEQYNKFDIDTASILAAFGVVKLELLRYRIHEDNILYVESENYQKIKIASSNMTKKPKRTLEAVKRLPKTYSVEDHFEDSRYKQGFGQDIVALFASLREKILALDENVVEEAKAKYIAYKLATNFVDVVVNQSYLKIFLNVKSGHLNDPKRIARDLTKPATGHWGNGDYETKLESQNQLDDVFELIKQSYNLNK